MGKATIIQNLGQPTANYSARYLIEFDLGVQEKADALAALNTYLAENENKTGEVLLEISQREQEDANLLNRALVAESDYIAALANAGDGGPIPDGAALKKARLDLSLFRLETKPLKLRLDALRFDRKRLLADVARWNTFQATEVKPAWMPNFPNVAEGLPVGSEVSTMEINGVQGLSLIGGNAQQSSPYLPARGDLLGRQAMSPEQAFFNAAILPGWQRHKPTYRSGVVAQIYDGDVGRIRVFLDDATSTPLGLNINPAEAVLPLASSFFSVKAFLPGDRVIVGFRNGDVNDAQVLGWLDGPKRPPVTFTLTPIFYQFGFNGVLVFSSGAASPSVPQPVNTVTLTRLNPTAVLQVPDRSPGALQIGSQGSVSASYLERFDQNPTQTTFGETIPYFAFPFAESVNDELLRIPVVEVDRRTVINEWPPNSGTYEGKREYALSGGFIYGNEVLFYPRELAIPSDGLGLIFSQQVGAGEFIVSGMSSVAAARAALNAFRPTLQIKATFPNGAVCDLICEYTEERPIGDFANQGFFEIVSCSLSSIPPL